MKHSQKTFVTGLIGLALLGCGSASASTLVYVVNGSQQFGTVDLATGAFQAIGPVGTEAGYFGLAPGLGGSLLTFSYSSDVYSIDPGTGIQTLLGPSGLADCTTIDSPCGPTSNASLGGLNGKIYATDFNNTLYNVDPHTGIATVIGSTGIPPIPFVPGTFNMDGTINFYDEAIFGANGKLYETFDTLAFDLDTFQAVSFSVAPALYQLNPLTGAATRIGSTASGIGGVTTVGGVNYAFDDMTGQILSLDVATGNTSMVGDFDPAAGVIQGAVAAAPEPCSITLVGLGLVAALVRKRLRCQ